ncbi:oxysterol-binding protein 2 isoform X3 [Notamacropus eugenii]|uniref:oxysterol-binding protein 2 isoform X3 n=1 Tax=Notamacropus eugenii TaxID=9315 RepID=UPI003B67DFF0
MGKAAAAGGDGPAGPGGGGGARGLSSLLSAVPCLSCHTEAPAMSALPPRPPLASTSPPPATPELAPTEAQPAVAEDGRGGSPYILKGWLLKWTNYLKGYQRRWFVLSNGLLSYYRNQGEMAYNCRATINLSTAHFDREDSCNILLFYGGRTYHLKAGSEVERQQWLGALELERAKAVRMMKALAGNRELQSVLTGDDSGDEDVPTHSDRSELQNTLSILSDKLDNLGTCNDLISKHGAALQRSLSELESLKIPVESGEKLKAVNERATLFRITSNAMINACQDFLGLAEIHSRKWQRALQYEQEQRIRLEETIEQLAKQHNSLERACRGAPTNPKSDSFPQGVKGDLSDEDEDTEYFDAMEDSSFITVITDPKDNSRSAEGENEAGPVDDWNAEDHVFGSAARILGMPPKVKRRTRIPDKPNYNINLWSIMKNCIGKELSKIPMPVSHHPPAAAHHVFSKNGWTLWQEITISSKFRGKYLSIMPLGAIHLEFQASGNHYIWRKSTSTVHNIIVGKLWIDQTGDIEIINHKTKDKCLLKFTPYSYFSKEYTRKVTGVVTDSKEKAHYVLSGSWDEKMECAKIVQSSHSSPSTEGKQKMVYQTLPAKLLWKKYPLPENAENMYYFSELALILNEPEEGVAPTDSRWRPDQRLMENGQWDEANSEKQRLEEKQRMIRRKRLELSSHEHLEEGKEEDLYKPMWFEKKMDPLTGEEAYIYKGGYWEAKEEQNWSMCPDIF